LEPSRPEGLISGVVIARNEAAMLGVCLAAVRRALDAHGGGDILVVDSASTDSTARVGIESGCRVLTVRRASRICPAAMRRIGASRSDSRYILFLDGDCELEPDFLGVALRAMESDASLGVVAGRRRDFYRKGQSLVPVEGEYYSDQPADTSSTPPAYGGSALYRRRALEDAGSFDPFLKAKEEEDLAQRIRAAGYGIEVLRVPMIRHMTVPRESSRRLLRSLRHGFYIGRGQAARVFLSRGQARAAFRGLDRVLFTLLNMTLGAICLWAGWKGTWWPALTWLILSMSTFGVFVFRARSLSWAGFYVLEWMVQGICLLVGLLMPRRSADSFWWEGEERAGERSGSICLPRVLLAGPLPAAPFRGGVEKGVALLLKGNLGHRTSMRLFNTYRDPDPSRSLGSRLTYQIGMIRRFRRELKSTPVDLVHVKTSSGINFHQNALYALVARLSGTPVLFQIHSGRFEAFYRKSIAPLRAWIRSTLSCSKRVAVLSRSWAGQVATIAPKAEIRVVPNGLDEEEMACLGDGGEIRSSQVLFLGTGRDDLNRDKGLEDIISVLPELARKHPESRWILAGLQNGEETYARLLREGIDPRWKEGRVCCHGMVDPPEKWDLLKASSILVLPSYFENMPNILLEGMAAGLGVVASDVGAIPEMLGYGEGGLLVPPGDRPALATALDRLLGSPSLVRAQGRRNLSAVARDYTMSIVQQQLEKLYLEVAGWTVVGDAVSLPPHTMVATGAGRDEQTPARPVSRS
jgi:glycosyltransferase involved in cell wall biosynthesis